MSNYTNPFSRGHAALSEDGMQLIASDLENRVSVYSLPLPGTLMPWYLRPSYVFDLRFTRNPPIPVQVSGNLLLVGGIGEASILELAQPKGGDKLSEVSLDSQLVALICQGK